MGEALGRISNRTSWSFLKLEIAKLQNLKSLITNDTKFKQVIWKKKSYVLSTLNEANCLAMRL